MIGIGRVYTLDICPSQLLASKTHNNLNLRHKITKKIAISMISIFLHDRNFALPYIALKHAQNCLSG